MLLLGYRYTVVCYGLYATSGLRYSIVCWGLYATFGISFHNGVLGFICYLWDIIPQLYARIYMLLLGYRCTIVC